MKDKRDKKLKQLRIIVFADVLITLILGLIIGMSLEGRTVQSLNIFEWIIAILPFILLTFALYIKLKKFPYICTKCNNEINIKPFNMFTFKGLKTIIIKCPHCKESVLAEIKID